MVNLSLCTYAYNNITSISGAIMRLSLGGVHRGKFAAASVDANTNYIDLYNPST